MNKEHTLIQEAKKLLLTLEGRGFTLKGISLKDDPIFQKVKREFVESVEAKISNYESYQEMCERFEKLAGAYCYISANNLGVLP